MAAGNAGHILFPLIDPPRDRAAFPVARIMARILSGPLHLVAAGAQPAAAGELARRLSVTDEELRAVVIENASGDLVDGMIRSVSALKQAMVILAVRLHGETPAIEAIGRRMLEQITCPILVVPPERDMSAWRLQRELLPQDGTPGCAAALAQVIRQSSRMGIENLVLRVAGAKVGQPTEPGSLATPRYVDHPQHEWEAWGREFLDRIFGMGANLNAVGLRLLMTTGEPAAEILRIAREEAVDMIILPWHCALGSGRARMIKAVLRAASCPVLLLPQRADQRCVGQAE